MKTLASCKPTEFLKQTNKIRRSVEKWLTDTDIMNIRKRMPHFEIVPKDATQDEKVQINERNEKAKQDQMKANLSAMLDSIMEDHADETMEILALCCFIEPANVDDHTVSEYMGALNELMNDENVINFFTSLVRLVPNSMVSA